MSKQVLDAIEGQFGEEVVLGTHSHHGDDTAMIVPEMIAQVCAWLKGDPEMAFQQMIDLTCVDWLPEEPRFEVVYHLASRTHGHRIRLKCRVSEAEPKLPSITPIWKGANWYEREAYDMYGVIFEGHPDLRRLLLYPEFIGHPLRKDYPIRGEQPLVTMRDPETQRPVMPAISHTQLVPLRGQTKQEG